MKRRQYDDRENTDIFAAAMAVAEAHQEPQEKRKRAQRMIPKSGYRFSEKIMRQQ
jgi:hypothetical protein